MVLLTVAWSGGRGNVTTTAL